MPLQFRPPEELVNAYLQRPSPGHEASAGIQQALQAYVQQKALQQQQQDAASGNVLKILETDPALMNTPFGQRMAKRSGADLTGYTPPGVSSGTVPAPTAIPAGQIPVDAQGNFVAGPQQGPQLPGVGMGMAAQQPPASGMGAPSLIARWQQRKTQPQAAPSAQAPSSVPDVASLMGRGALGKKEIDKYKEQQGMAKSSLEMQKLQRDLATDPNAEVPVLTQEAALAKGSVNPKAKVFATARSEEADLRHQDRMAKAVTDFGRQIETHPIIKKLMDQDVGLGQVEEMADLVNSGNSVASSAMGTKMAKAMGEVGALTEDDVKRYINSGKLTQGAADKLRKWTKGTPSDATMQEINQISSVLRDSFGSKIQPIYDRHIERFARAYKITPEEASYQLAIPYKKIQGGRISASPTGPYSDPEKEARYQAWKAKQRKP